VLYEPEASVPVEVSPGLFRLTTNTGPDYVRGVLADGRVLYLTSGLEGGPAAPGIVSVTPDGGPVRSEAGAYGTVLPGLVINDYYATSTRRTLLTVIPPRGRDHYCGDIGFPAPTPQFVGWRLFVLPESDGPAFSSLNRFEREFPLFANSGFDPSGRPNQPKRIRLVPALHDADSSGTRSAGPAITASGQYAYLSDMEMIWRIDLSDTTAAPVAVTEGAYPLLSAGGDALFVARASLTDSLSTPTLVVYGFAGCFQTIVTFTVSEWTTIRIDIAGVEDTIGVGSEAALLGDSALVVRRPDGLHALRLSDGVSTRIIEDPTARSPAVAPDGSFIAFTSRRFGNPDVFVLRLD
ncbi:MAG: hypothetical protein WEC54_01935, partial [Gemmatimonadales bacterium]